MTPDQSVSEATAAKRAGAGERASTSYRLT